jgi:hypothetical protein
MTAIATATLGTALDGTPELMTVNFDLAIVGYSTHEHFVSGTATSFAAAGPREADGRWEVAPDATANFTTRVVVYRPADAARANGTVIVEWLNVTGGLDIPAVWMPTHRHLVREGFTWVGVSAQVVGIEGGGMMPGMGLRQSAPDRYAGLDHPGDAFSYDMFTQVARAIADALPRLYGVRVDRLIAAGASQSAFHLTTYVNAIDHHAQTFDGFLLQGRAGRAAPLEGWTLTGDEAMKPETRRARIEGEERVRDDARVPVMIVQSETDVFGALAYFPSRQADSERFRLWEVAGASHCDTYFLCAAAFDSGSLPVGELAALIDTAADSGMPLEVPMNSGPQMHYVLQRAFDSLDTWLREGTPPATADRLADDGGRLARDDLGIGRGGVRTPWVDAPTTVLSGLGQPGDMSELFGTTRDLEPGGREARYPGGRDEYVSDFRAATRAAVDAGLLLAVDAPEVEALGALGWRDPRSPPM